MSILFGWIKKYYEFCFVMLNIMKPKREFIGLKDGDDVTLVETQESKEQNFLHIVLGIVMLVLPVAAPVFWASELYQYLNSKQVQSSKIAFAKENQQNIKKLLRSTMANFDAGNLDQLIQDVDNAPFFKDKIFKATEEYSEINSYYRASKIINLINKENVIKLSACAGCLNLYEQLSSDDTSGFALEIYKRLMPSVDRTVDVNNLTELYAPTLRLVQAKSKILKDDTEFMNSLKNHTEVAAIGHSAGVPSDTAIPSRVEAVSAEAGFSYAGFKINSYKIDYMLFSYTDITPESEWKFYDWGNGFTSSSVNHPSWHVSMNFSTSSHDNIDAEFVGTKSQVIVMKFKMKDELNQVRETASEAVSE